MTLKIYKDPDDSKMIIVIRYLTNFVLTDRIPATSLDKYLKSLGAKQRAKS